MDPILRDLLGHQFWADAEMWKALGGHPAARDDKAIHDRLHHVHLVQRFFVWAVGGQSPQPRISKPEDFPSRADLEVFARESHAEIQRFLDTVAEDRLSQRLTVPWFKDPPLTITVSEALTQCAMHSHHHRAQNATRLRELGGVPPTLDLIVWYWKERPKATW